jgi:hypothetical protein
VTRNGASHGSTSSFGEAQQVDRFAVEADGSPRIGDVVLDPFVAHRRGEVRLAERDFWVTVAPRQPVVEGEP